MSERSPQFLFASAVFVCAAAAAVVLQVILSLFKMAIIMEAYGPFSHPTVLLIVLSLLDAASLLFCIAALSWLTEKLLGRKVVRDTKHLIILFCFLAAAMFLWAQVSDRLPAFLPPILNYLVPGGIGSLFWLPAIIFQYIAFVLADVTARRTGTDR